jgi:hypothetical protein
MLLTAVTQIGRPEENATRGYDRIGLESDIATLLHCHKLTLKLGWSRSVQANNECLRETMLYVCHEHP